MISRLRLRTDGATAQPLFAPPRKPCAPRTGDFALRTARRRRGARPPAPRAGVRELARTPSPLHNRSCHRVTPRRTAGRSPRSSLRDSAHVPGGCHPGCFPARTLPWVPATAASEAGGMGTKMLRSRGRARAPRWYQPVALSTLLVLGIGRFGLAIIRLSAAVTHSSPLAPWRPCTRLALRSRAPRVARPVDGCEWACAARTTHEMRAERARCRPVARRGSEPHRRRVGGHAEERPASATPRMDGRSHSKAAGS